MKKRNRLARLLLMPLMVFAWAFGWILYSLESDNKHKNRKTLAPVNFGKTSIRFSRSLAVEKPSRIDPKL